MEPLGDEPGRACGRHRRAGHDSAGSERRFELQQTQGTVELIAPRLTRPPMRPMYTRPPRIEMAKTAAKVSVKIAPMPKVEAPKIDAPKMEMARIEAPRLEAAALSVPRIDLPAPPVPQPPREVKVGGFGDPNGVHPSETSSAKGLVMARTGAFDLPAGSGEGRGGGKLHAVALAGFGDGTGLASSGGHPNGSVQRSGFGDYQSAAAPVRAVAAVQSVSSTGVEILFKPRPLYTPEARERHLEGEVQLDVLFRASGQAEVLRVIRGLGLGLDEAASHAASQIRFRPGTRDGAPIDMRGIVHIVFQLS